MKKNMVWQKDTMITGGNIKCEENQEEEQGREIVLEANSTSTQNTVHCVAT